MITAVALPGTGSDADFARRAFAPALTDADIPLVAVDPDPLGVVKSYREALDDAARHGAVLIAGISIGAVVGLDWATTHPEATAGVIATLPPWLGLPGSAPAALSAALTADQLRTDGLEAVIARMQAGSPAWLAAALTQSWRAQWPHLPSALDEAATYHAPDEDDLARCPVPVAVVGATDDPVHPFAVAETWARCLPNARLAQVTLDDIGTDPAILGRRGLAELTVQL